LVRGPSSKKHNAVPKKDPKKKKTEMTPEEQAKKDAADRIDAEEDNKVVEFQKQL
jgi:hypothetical protein